MKRYLLTVTITLFALFEEGCGPECLPFDSDPSTGADTDTVSDSDPPKPFNVTDLDWWLNEDIESMVYVSWIQDGDGTVHVEYQVDDEWRLAPSFYGNEGQQEQLIVGIPYSMDAEWRVVPEPGESADGETITTGPLPKGLPLAAITVSNQSGWLQEGKFLLTSMNQNTGGWTGGTYWTFIIDRQARPVWARKAPLDHWTLFAQIAQSGDHILWDEATKWSSGDSGAGSMVHFTYLDAEIDVVPTPGLHHAFVQLPDGTLVWGSKYHGGGEALVEKFPGADKGTILWTCYDDWPGVDDCESNGIFYQESTDSFLYSFYTNNSIVEVDRATGVSMWWAGGVPGGYSFDPANTQYSWQHGISYTDAGTLLVSTEGEGATMLREYIVNHDLDQLESVWSYNPGVHAGTNGDAWRLANGNTLHVVGSAGHIIEVTEDGEEVWHLDYGGDHLLGRGEFIEDLYALITPN